MRIGRSTLPRHTAALTGGTCAAIIAPTTSSVARAASTASVAEYSLTTTTRMAEAPAVCGGAFASRAAVRIVPITTSAVSSHQCRRSSSRAVAGEAAVVETLSLDDVEVVIEDAAHHANTRVVDEFAGNDDDIAGDADVSGAVAARPPRRRTLSRVGSTSQPWRDGDATASSPRRVRGSGSIDDDRAATTALNRSNDNAGFDDHSSSSSGFVESTAALDPYARAKIVNFVKRRIQLQQQEQLSVERDSQQVPLSLTAGHQGAGNGPSSSASASSSALAMTSAPAPARKSHLATTNSITPHFDEAALFETQQIDENLYRCSMRLPLPAAYGDRIARGEGSTAKDAETLAAMHATLVVDALGFPLYTLPSMQRKHAAAAREQGRWAPAPEDAPRAPSTPSPPPLRRLSGLDESEEGEWRLVDVGPCEPFIAPAHTLLSPALLDPTSSARVRRMWPELGMRNEAPPVVFREVPPALPSETRMTIAEITLRDVTELLGLAPEVAHWKARGKAADAKTAGMLANMHLELLLDALGVPLHPTSHELQAAHAAAARAFGRGVAESMVDTTQRVANAVPPAALKGLKGVSWASRPTPRFSKPSNEERLVQRHCELAERAVRDAVHATIVMRPDRAHVETLQRFLTAHGEHRGNPFFAVRMRNGGARATVVIPPVAGMSASGQPTVGGIGEAPTVEEAEALAAEHALECLNILGILIFADDAEAQAQYDAQRRARGKIVASEVSAVQPLPPFLRKSGMASMGTNAVPANTLPDNGTTSATPAPSGPPPQPSDAKATLRNVSRIGSARASAANSGGKADAFIRTTQATPSYWDLRPDTHDGFMLAVCDPAAVAAAKADDHFAAAHDGALSRHALLCPRYIDVQCRTRFVAFAAMHGKTPHDCATSTRHMSKDNMRVYRTALRLPVHARYGERVATGEAATQHESEVLAAMHAELIVDALGLPLFADAKAQTRHAEAARAAGRFAPMPGDTPGDPATPSPPPLRAFVPETHLRTSERPLGYTPTAADAQAAHAAAEAAIDAAASSAPPVPKAAALTPDSRELLDLPMEVVGTEAFDIVARARIGSYLRRQRRVEVEPECGVIPDETAGSTGLHTAILALPVPPRFGDRVAVGLAVTKRDAEVACFMHAERILDALGIPVMPLPGLQLRHAERVARLGRKAPRPGDSPTARPADTPTPPALRYDPNGLVRPSHAPVPPSLNANDGRTPQQRHDAWAEYVAAAERFIHDVTRFDRTTFVLADRVPRTGDTVVDEALDELEEVLKTGLAPEIKNHLMHYCQKMNVEYPQNWNTTYVGTATCRKSFTRIPVPGFPHVEAMGVATSKEVSQRRAALHALLILRRLDPDFGLFEQYMNDLLRATGGNMPTSTPSGGGRRQKGPDHGSFDRLSGQFTLDGKMRLVSLYTLCNGLPPPAVTHRERVEAGRVQHVTSVEVLGPDGERIAGTAQEAGRKTNEPAAYDDLVNALLRRVPQFGALARLIRTHPHLDPEHVVQLAIPADVEADLMDILNTPHPVEQARLQQQEQQQYDEHGNPVAPVSDAPYPSQQLQSSMMMIGEATTLQLAKKVRETAALDPVSERRLNDYLTAIQARKLASPEYQEKFEKRRSTLSIAAKKDEILQTVAAHRVTVLCGTTGCGKTTQVPQFLLDAATAEGQGASCTIMVTQPRRISAISIAQRIAAERLEKIGETVGYTVRLDSKPGSNINFCTSGVMLRICQSQPDLASIKYLIIDEIHERDINSDFLLILVKQLIQRRSDLRVILMSATLQAEVFQEYFEGAPVINVEGYVYPCKEMYLDEVAPLTQERGVVTPTAKAFLAGQEVVATVNGNLTGNATPVVPNSAPQSLGEAFNADPVAAPGGAVVPIGSTAHSRRPAYATLEAPTDLDLTLVAFSIEHAAKHENLNGGSILVFLPGWDEIVRLRDLFASSAAFHVLPLHSSVSAAEQLQCFEPAPEGKVKLVLATNIAESGVTIDDVGCVIDTGRAKEKTYLTRRGRTAVGRDEMGTMSQLVNVLASKANVVQRRGRAGRTREGVCIRLYSRRQMAELAEFTTPEMLRQPLDSLCLQIISLGLGDPGRFLQQALEPPPPDSITAAMNRLFNLGAITETGALTPLGARLALLPVNPRVGKTLLFGAALRCLDAALTLAATADVDPFVQQREVKDMVRVAREELAMGSWSDPIASLNAYNTWASSKCLDSADKVKLVEATKMLSPLSLATITKYKEQYYDILRQSGFLEDGVGVGAAASGGDGKQKHHGPSWATSAEPIAPPPPPPPPPHPAASTEPSAASSSPVGGAVEEVNPWSVGVEAVPPSAQAQEVSHGGATDDATARQHELDEEEDALDDDAEEALPHPHAHRHERPPPTTISGDVFIDRSPLSASATSLPLVKSVICTGLFPSVALLRDRRRYRSKLENTLHPFSSSVIAKAEEGAIENPFFVYDEMVKSATDARVMFKGITNAPFWGIVLLGASTNLQSHVEFRAELGLAILDRWLVFRISAAGLDTIQRLKQRFALCIETKFLDPGNAVNNTMLQRLQGVIQQLVEAPQSSGVGESAWVERGSIVPVVTHLDAMPEALVDNVAAAVDANASAETTADVAAARSDSTASAAVEAAAAVATDRAEAAAAGPFGAIDTDDDSDAGGAQRRMTTLPTPGVAPAVAAVSGPRSVRRVARAPSTPLQS